ncbi:MAG: antitoxin family protein [Gemmatales bacterium]
MTIRAIYAGGVFRPLQPLTLPEGSQVDIIYGIDKPVTTYRGAGINEIEYQQRVNSVRSLDELIAVQATAPALPAGYDLCEALDANRQATGERKLFRDNSAGEVS